MIRSSRWIGSLLPASALSGCLIIARMAGAAAPLHSASTLPPNPPRQEAAQPAEPIDVHPPTPPPIIAETPNTPALLERANAALRAQQWREATSLFEEVLADDPRNPDAYYGLGLSFESEREYEAAIVEYRHLRDLDAGPIWTNLAESKLAALSYVVAAEHFINGERMAASERYPEALAAFRIAHELSPPPGLDFLARDRYYACLVRAVTKSIRETAAERGLTRIGLGDFAGAAEPGRVDELRERLAAALTAGGAPETIPIPLAEWETRLLLDGANPGPFIEELPAIIVGAFDSEIILALVETPDAATLWSAYFGRIGSVPPGLPHQVWQTLIPAARPEPAYRLELGLDADLVAPEDPVTLHFSAAQSGFIRLLLARDDGALEIRAIGAEPENDFILAGEQRTLVLPPMQQTGVVGIALIIAEKELPLPNELAPSAKLQPVEALTFVTRLRQQLAERPAEKWMLTYVKLRVAPRPEQ